MKTSTALIAMLDERRRIVMYFNSARARLASRKGMISLPAHAFGRLQSQTGEELDALLPSVLDRAFKGEL